MLIRDHPAHSCGDLITCAHEYNADTCSPFKSSSARGPKQGRPGGSHAMQPPPHSAAAPFATPPPGLAALPPPLFGGQPCAPPQPAWPILGQQPPPTGSAFAAPPIAFSGPPPTGARPFGAPLPIAFSGPPPTGAQPLGALLGGATFGPPEGPALAAPPIGFPGPPLPGMPPLPTGAQPAGAQLALGPPMMGAVRVGKISEAPSGAINIMRPSVLGNPFDLAQSGGDERARNAVCDSHQMYLTAVVHNTPYNLHDIGGHYGAAVAYSHAHHVAGTHDGQLREAIAKLAGTVAGGNTIWLGCNCHGFAEAGPRCHGDALAREIMAVARAMSAPRRAAPAPKRGRYGTEGP